MDKGTSFSFSFSLSLSFSSSAPFDCDDFLEVDSSFPSSPSFDPSLSSVSSPCVVEAVEGREKGDGMEESRVVGEVDIASIEVPVLVGACRRGVGEGEAEWGFPLLLTIEANEFEEFLGDIDMGGVTPPEEFEEGSLLLGPPFPANVWYL